MKKTKKKAIQVSEIIGKRIVMDTFPISIPNSIKYHDLPWFGRGHMHYNKKRHSHRNKDD